MLVGKHPQSGKHVDSHLTACSTLLSRGLRLGSLVDERMPVPQLLARVFLIHQNRNERHRTEENKNSCFIPTMHADKKNNNFSFYIKTKRLLTLHETLAEIDSRHTDRKNKPVKEGGQQPPQQHLVSGPCAHVTVHELGSWYIHRSTCKKNKSTQKWTTELIYCFFVAFSNILSSGFVGYLQ